MGEVDYASSLWPISLWANFGLNDSIPKRVNQYPTNKPRNNNMLKPIKKMNKKMKKPSTFVNIRFIFVAAKVQHFPFWQKAF